MSRDSVREVHESTPVSARRLSRVRAVASLSVAAALTLAGCGSAAPEVTADVSPSPSASPSPVASASPSPEVVVSSPDNPIAEVPWDEVGDGWFLVEQRVQRSFSWGDEFSDVIAPIGESDGRLLLLSPQGSWYQALSYQGTGIAYAIAWSGETVFVAIEGMSQPETNYVALNTINVRSGATVKSDVYPQGYRMVALSDDAVVSYYFGGDGLTVSLLDADQPTEILCSSIYHSAQGASVALPGGGLRLLCLNYRSDGRTDVDIFDVNDKVSRTTVDTFRLGADRYEVFGWLDPETFILGRRTGEDWSSYDAFFSYNVSTRKLADYSLVPPAEGSMFFDPVSQRRIDHSSAYCERDACVPGETTVSTFDGGEVVQFPDECEQGSDVALSGDRMLLYCRGGADVRLIELENGDVVGRWALEENMLLDAFGR